MFMLLRNFFFHMFIHLIMFLILVVNVTLLSGLLVKFNFGSKKYTNEEENDFSGVRELVLYTVYSIHP